MKLDMLEIVWVQWIAFLVDQWTKYPEEAAISGGRRMIILTLRRPPRLVGERRAV